MINRLLLISVFLLTIISNSQSQGFLHRHGKKIVTGSGNEILLRGMGLGGWMLQEPYMLGIKAKAQFEIKEKIADLIGAKSMNEFYDLWLANHCTKPDIDSLAKWGFNSIRLPMHYNLYTLPSEQEPVPGENTWLQKGFTLTDSLLGWCKANKIYLILDLHAAPGGQGHDVPISDVDKSKNNTIWESATNRAKTVALWKKLAEHYANEPWIGGYDILNEPNWELPGGIMIKELYTNIISAIREVDKNHILFIEGNWFANDYTGLLPETPSAHLMDENMAYSFHKYWNPSTKNTIQWVLDIREKYNVPLWLGESGENSNEWFYQNIKLIEDNNIGWAWWTQKKIGSVTNPNTIKRAEAFKTLLDYWRNGGAKPDSAFAKKTLFQLAEDIKTEHCTFNPDVLDAMFRQIRSNTSIPYKTNKIPGTIYFSDFDMGRLNSSYFDKDYMNNKESQFGGNRGWTYRNDGVDIEKCTDNHLSNGYNVCFTADKEWMKYTVKIDSSGTYNVTFRLASQQKPISAFHIEHNGTDVTGLIKVDSTGEKQNWKSVTVKNISFSKGTDTIIVKIDKGGANLSSMTWTKSLNPEKSPLKLFSAKTNETGSQITLEFNQELLSAKHSVADFTVSNGSSLKISKVEQNPTNKKQIKITLTDEVLFFNNINLSYKGNSIKSVTGEMLSSIANEYIVNTLPERQIIPCKIEAENYTVNSGFGHEECKDTLGGRNMSFSDSTDFLDYLVYVKETAIYTAEYRIAGKAGKAELLFADNDKQEKLTTIEFPGTSDYQKWKSVQNEVKLTKGTHTLRFMVLKGGFNFNYLSFTVKK